MDWLQKGSSGDEVKVVQQRLLAMGFNPGPIDGIFGSKTDAAVRRFQENKGLQVDGIVGPHTFGALGITDQAPAKPLMAKEGGEGHDKPKPKSGNVIGARAADARATEKAKAAEKMGAKAEKEKAEAVDAMKDAMKKTEEETKPKKGFFARLRERRDQGA